MLGRVDRRHLTVGSRPRCQYHVLAIFGDFGPEFSVIAELSCPRCKSERKVWRPSVQNFNLKFHRKSRIFSVISHEIESKLGKLKEIEVIL